VDEGDDANGVVIKLYGEETNGAVSIIEQPFEPGLLLPPHVHENDVWLYVLEGEMHARVGKEVVKATPGCWVEAATRREMGGDVAETGDLCSLRRQVHDRVEN
jgi:quercetin dioxygenase-like cupin family protein